MERLETRKVVRNQLHWSREDGRMQTRGSAKERTGEREGCCSTQQLTIFETEGDGGIRDTSKLSVLAERNY